MTTASGIVRPARRPWGWRAPGPLPAGGGPELAPGPLEDLCYLAGDWRILQRRDGHRWSLDDLVTAWFASELVRAAPPSSALDLGCGIGAVLLLLAWRFPRARVTGIEAQPLSRDLARRSIVWNGVADRCRAVAGDLREPASLPAGATFPLVTGTPPYLPPGTGVESRRVQVGACHFEHRGGVEDYCAAAARWLAPGGTFATCAGAAQVARLGAAAAAAGLTIAERMDVIPRAGKPPLFSVYGVCRAPGSSLRVRPPLVVRDGRGRRTADFRALRHDMGMPP